MSTHVTAEPSTAPTVARRLTTWAGWFMVVIATAHTALFLPNPHWSGWTAGDMRSGTAEPESMAMFWTLPGGFVVVLALLGLLVARSGRRDQPVPAYVGWAILGWGLLCVALIGPSGFVAALLPAGLLIAADVVTRRDRRHG